MALGMVTIPIDPFSFPGLMFQLYDSVTGVFDRETTCESPVYCPTDIYPFCQTSDGSIYAHGSTESGFSRLIKFDASLVFVEEQDLTRPTPESDPPFGVAPEPVADDSGNLYGVWANLATTPPEVNETVLVQINTTTYAQTVLWRNFQPLYAGERPFVNNAYGMSPSGSKFYYSTAPGNLDFLQLDIASGVTTVFAASIDTGWGPAGITENISVGANGNVYTVWSKTATAFVRGVVYNAAGSLLLDLDFDEEFAIVFFAPLPDSSGFWAFGQLVSDGTYEARFFTLPSGTPGTVIAVPKPTVDSQFYEMHIMDVEDVPPSGDFCAEVTCADPIVTSIVPDCTVDPITMTIYGTDFPDDAEGLVIKGPDDNLITFDIVSATSTQIVINNIVPAFNNGQYCVAFGTPPIAEYLLCQYAACSLSESSGIYFLDTAATHDTLYLNYTPVITGAFKIP